MEAHRNALTALATIGLSDDGEGNSGAPADVMEKIKAKNSALVEEGLRYLFQAVRNRPNYDDAMTYINLMYRCKASLDWGNEEDRADDVAKAKAWMSKAMAARKAHE